MRRHVRSTAILIACYACASAWISLAAFLLLFAIGAAGGGGRVLTWLSAASLVCAVASGAGYLLLALNLRCENCGTLLFLEGGEPKHPKAKKALAISYWASSVFEVVRYRRLTCMHCGEEYAFGGDGAPPQK